MLDCFFFILAISAEILLWDIHALGHNLYCTVTREDCYVLPQGFLVSWEFIQLCINFLLDLASKSSSLSVWLSSSANSRNKFWVSGDLISSEAFQGTTKLINGLLMKISHSKISYRVSHILKGFSLEKIASP